jgi:hypothetical protein
MSHFMMDCYFPDVRKPGGQTCDSLPIKAPDDHVAVEEAKRIAIWKKPVRFEVRSVSRGGNRTVFVWGPPA